jgi:hypothetical protein
VPEEPLVPEELPTPEEPPTPDELLLLDEPRVPDELPLPEELPTPDDPLLLDELPAPDEPSLPEEPPSVVPPASGDPPVPVALPVPSSVVTLSASRATVKVPFCAVTAPSLLTFLLLEVVYLVYDEMLTPGTDTVREPAEAELFTMTMTTSPLFVYAET